MNLKDRIFLIKLADYPHNFLKFMKFCLNLGMDINKNQELTKEI